MRKAFTLTEILIVLAILSALLATGWPILAGYQRSAAVKEYTIKAVSLIRQAEFEAVAGFLNVPHGVKLFTNKMIIFAGSSYSSRNTAFDRELPLDEAVVSWSLSGSGSSSEVVFSKSRAEPSRNGTIKFTFKDGVIKNIIVSNLGLIEIQ
ncbi:MAG: type II secretion system protein [Patescibacteria group bacterium]|nr:type II secretion system protein [Patescibacteria group bacterium]